MVQREERNALRLPRRVDTSQAEVDLVTALIQRHGLQAELGGPILLLGERFRIDHPQRDLAISLTLIGMQQLLNAPCIVA